MKNVTIQPDECWDYFLENRDDLLINEHILAENKEEYGIEICLGNQFDLPIFNVYLDDDVIFTDFVSAEENAQEACTDILTEIYNDYLDDIESTLKTIVTDEIDDDVGVDDDVGNDNSYEQSDEYWDKLVNQDQSAIQEQQIDETLEEFLGVICDCFVKRTFTPNEFEDIKDHFCEYVARKYRKKVYRPMYLEREDGTEFFAEFPYDNMVFDDPDNPIYK